MKILNAKEIKKVANYLDQFYGNNTCNGCGTRRIYSNVYANYKINKVAIPPHIYAEELNKLDVLRVNIHDLSSIVVECLNCAAQTFFRYTAIFPSNEEGEV